MIFEIKGELPTMNEIIKVAKAHYGVYATMKKKNTQRVVEQCKRLKPIERADISVTWYCKDKRKDKDNIATGIKFIQDGLVEAGVLKNDGWKEIGYIRHFFEVDKDNPRIVVELTEF